MSLSASIAKQKGEEYYVFKERNCIMTFAPQNVTGYGEIVLYKKPISVPAEVGNIDMEKRKRTFIRDADGYNVAQKTVNLSKIDFSLHKCGKRATKNIILYAMANKWEQFITLTFSADKVNRYDEIECKEKWREFQQFCVRKFPACKLLAVWEYHKKSDEWGAKALHFHVLASGLNFETIPYIYPDGKQRTSKSGAPLHILSPKAWEFGFSTVAYLPKDGKDNARVANYLTKYVSKTRARKGDTIKMSEEAGNYGAKRYFHTRNLKICERLIMDELMTYEQIATYAAEYGFSLHKDTDKMIVFRRYDIPPDNTTPLVEVTQHFADTDAFGNSVIAISEGLQLVTSFEHEPPPQKMKLQLVVDENELDVLNRIF